MKRLAGLVLAAVVAAGCGPSTTSPATSAMPSDGAGSTSLPSADGQGARVLSYTCGNFPFGLQILTDPPRSDEDANTSLGAAFRAHLAAPGIEHDNLPDDGWTLAGNDGVVAEFVAVVDDDQLVFASLRNEAGFWRVLGWGNCQPVIVLAAGLGEASWRWGDFEPPNASTTTFDALVTERSCASGKSSAGRVVGPEFVIGPEHVLVIFAVRPQPGLTFTCQGNPATRLRVELPEPLGDRPLLDGGQLPFGDPLGPPL
jgi:hypothetical protein